MLEVADIPVSQSALLVIDAQTAAVPSPDSTC